MEEGDTSKYNMDEKVRIYEILKDNSNIIVYYLKYIKKCQEEKLN